MPTLLAPSALSSPVGSVWVLDQMGAFSLLWPVTRCHTQGLHVLAQRPLTSQPSLQALSLCLLPDGGRLHLCGPLPKQAEFTPCPPACHPQP